MGQLVDNPDYRGDMFVEQLPSGTWRVVVRVNGQRHRATRRTRREAEIAGGRLLEQHGVALTDTATLGALLQEHINKHGYAATTASDYQRVLDRLPEKIRATPITAVTTGWLVSLYERLSDQGWTQYRVVRCHELMGAAFGRAVRHDLVVRNPARGAAPPRPPAPDLLPPTDDEMRRLLDAAGDILPAVLLAAAVGLRRGELVGLQWRDVDLKQATLTIRRAVAYVPGSPLIVKELKNGEHGYRVVAVDDDTLALLRSHRTTAIEGAMAAGRSVDPEHFVFSRHLGERPWRPDFATKQWATIRKRVGLETVRLYDVRHWMVTTMLAAGEPIATVAGRAGHDPVTMLRRYWHFVPAADRAEANRHGAKLRGLMQPASSS